MDLEKLKKKSLKKGIEKILKKNPNVLVSSIVYREKGSPELMVENFVPTKLTDLIEMINSLGSGDYIIHEIYTLNKKNAPLALNTCFPYGCLDCEAPNCDEECEECV